VYIKNHASKTSLRCPHNIVEDSEESEVLKKVFHTTVQDGTGKPSKKEGQHMALLNLEGYWQNILATFVENGNINIRDELRDLGQQPNF